MTLRSAITVVAIAGILNSAHVLVAQEPKFGEARKVTQTCTLKVEGMACGACENRVQKVAKKVDGVSDASADHKHNTARITYDPTKTNPTAIAKAITENAGFKSAVRQ
jgi:copper chaperone